MTPLARLLLLPALALTSLVATAAPERYALDPVHTRVLFAVEHAGFSKALGTVSGTSGTLIFDPDDWAAARLDVTVPLHRADLGDAKWNEATLARNLLDAERFPDAHFVSTRVEASGENHAKVTGNLTL
ncbi:polyisoprenoid-binding protein, partial [Xanthomonas oryzae pv. oryzae]